MTLSRKPSLGTTTVFDLNDNIDYFKISGTEMHVHERALHLEVGQVISTGTFSKVYNVRQVNTKQDFALKVKNYTTETEKKVADHEKNIVSLLMKDKKSCQYIIKIHGCFEYKSLICAIMTRGDIDLNSYQEKNGRKALPMSFVKPTACQLLDAVEYIHARGVLHLNIKPENCILKSMGGNKYLLKLCDFGTARLETDQEGLLCNSHGSLCYRAPEIIFGSSVNFRSDIWSCGLVIAEMYMGVALFPAVNEWQMAMFCRQLLGSMDLSSGDRYDMFFSYNFIEDSDDMIPYKSYLAAGGEGDYIPEDQLPDNRQHDLTSLDQMVEMGHNCSQLNYISTSDFHLLEVLYHMINITPFYRLSASELKSFDFFILRTSKRRLSL